MSTKDERIDLLQGTLDLLILRTLRLEPAHGHAIVKAIGTQRFIASQAGVDYLR